MSADWPPEYACDNCGQAASLHEGDVLYGICERSHIGILSEMVAERDRKIAAVRLVVASLNMTDRGTGHNHAPGDGHEDCAGCWTESIAEALADGGAECQTPQTLPHSSPRSTTTP